MPLFVAIAMVLMSSVLICCTKDVMSLKFLYSVCNRLYSVCIRLYSFVLRLYSVCTPFVPLGMLAPKGFCTPFAFLCIRVCSVCTRLYRPRYRFSQVVVFNLYSFVFRLCSFVLRLYSFVLSVIAFPSRVCTPLGLVCAPFVLVCTARDVVSLRFLYSVRIRLYSHPVWRI